MKEHESSAPKHFGSDSWCRQEPVSRLDAQPAEASATVITPSGSHSAPVSTTETIEKKRPTAAKATRQVRSRPLAVSRTGTGITDVELSRLTSVMINTPRFKSGGRVVEVWITRKN